MIQRLSGQCGQGKSMVGVGARLGAVYQDKAGRPRRLPRGSVFLCPGLTQPVVKERDRRDNQVADGSD